MKDTSAPTLENVLPPRVQSVIDRLRECRPGDAAVRQEAAAMLAELSARSEPDLLVLNTEKRIARRGGVRLDLSPKQTLILQALLADYPHVVETRDIYKIIYGEQARSINTIRVMMTELRIRLFPLKATIQNQHGRGYRLELNPVTPEVIR